MKIKHLIAVAALSIAMFPTHQANAKKCSTTISFTLKVGSKSPKLFLKQVEIRTKGSGFMGWRYVTSYSNTTLTSGSTYSYSNNHTLKLKCNLQRQLKIKFKCPDKKGEPSGTYRCKWSSWSSKGNSNFGTINLDESKCTKYKYCQGNGTGD